ncbi:MAG: ATP-binding protein [Acidobacteria bacterium]|nr:ATP-binding protein [Acidobacteriota bacterium]
MLTAPAPQLRLFPVWLLLGPRQVGKSSLLDRCADGHAYVSLDDLDTRERANRDPVLFIRELRPPFVIDEIQYAPKLLSPIKRMVDAGGLEPGAIRLTGSQSYEVMEGVTETLAGRVAILNLLGLSDEEKALPPTLAPDACFRRILETGFPKLCGIEDRAARDLYLSSYVQTYIERDIRELLRIEKRREFETFVKLCALRTSQVVNYDDLGRDAGVSAGTARSWLSLLEDAFLIRLLSPYFTNRTRRMIKSPKLYFLDAGLAAWLGGWRTADEARLGPMGGALFETHVLAEVIRRYRHRAREVDVHFWRTRDGQEIDFLIESDGRTWPVEVKLGSPRHDRLPSLRRIAEPSWQPGQVASLAAPAAPARLADDWVLCAPGHLDLGTGAGPRAP